MKSTSRSGATRLGSRGPKPGEGGRPRKYAADHWLQVVVNPDLADTIGKLADACNNVNSAYEYAQSVLAQLKYLDASLPSPLVVGLDCEESDSIEYMAQIWAAEEPETRKYENAVALVQAYVRSLIAADSIKRRII